MTLKNDGRWDEEDKRDFQVPTPNRQGWLHIQVRGQPRLAKNKNILAKFIYNYIYIYIYIS